MLVIRLQRIGKKHQPSYRVVVAERRSKLGAPPSEDLGSYNPFTKLTNFKSDRILYWIKSGSQVSPTVRNLLVKYNIIAGPKVAIPIKKRKEEAQAPAAAPAPTQETKPVTTTASGSAPASASKEAPSENISTSGDITKSETTEPTTEETTTGPTKVETPPAPEAPIETLAEAVAETENAKDGK